MATQEELVVRAVRDALRIEEGVGERELQTVRVSVDHGDTVLEGEVSGIAAKKLALERTATVRGVDRIIDRLHVHTDSFLDDAAIADRICKAFLVEPSLTPFAIRRSAAGEVETFRAKTERTPGELEVRVEDGVVTLDGDVTDLGAKRLAGVRAWWVAGVRDVVNGLGVTPPEQDSDAKMADGVRVALGKDPRVDAERIKVSCRQGVVALRGFVTDSAERATAERDAWCVFGVDRVVDLLRVLH